MSRVTFKIFENHCYGHFPIIFYSFQNTESRRWYLKFTHQITWNHRVVLRDYYMTFSISALVLARDSHIKPDSEAGGLMWVEGWYQGPYGKFHVIIFLSHILHWPFPSIDFYIANKIYELANCQNKSLIELPLFNLQIFLFRIWFQKYTKQCRSVQWR
jgi:hypothetical protein